MQSLTAKFEELRRSGEKALVLFVTAGDQPIEDLPDVLNFLEDAGADVIEVGIPFSDPFGEGPTIQASSQRSLDRGVNPQLVLDSVAKAHPSIPVVTMGYYNPVLRFGLENFARESHAAGVTGTIISDLIPDEADAWCRASAENHLETIFLAAPTSTEGRLKQVAERSTGFVYAVSRTGVTGAESSVPQDVPTFVQRIRSFTEKPICVGFGISNAAQAKEVARIADGIVVGSALVAAADHSTDEALALAVSLRNALDT